MIIKLNFYICRKTIIYLLLSNALEMGTCFHRGPRFGEYERTLISQDLPEKDKISFHRKNFYKELERRARRLRKFKTLSRGAPLENLQRGSFTGDFERQREGGSRDM
jgi:hypothetical protein